MGKILILGIDGYIGWPLAIHLSLRGYEVIGVDNLNRRKWVERLGSQSVLPILSPFERLRKFYLKYHKNITFFFGSVTDYQFLRDIFHMVKPDVIVHLAEQPSAPYSMKGQKECIETYTNNVIGTLNVIWAIKEMCPDAHLVKLGTMGVYSYELPIDVPEGDLEVEYKGKKVKLPYPKLGASWYHRSKSCDSINLEFASQLYGLTVTDCHQGIVYGTRIDEMEDDIFFTRYDVDEAFGTVINRFVAQAVVGIPLTLYGKGHQKRGFLPLRDSIQCLRLLIENPPKKGEYRVVNQIENHYDLTEIAEKVVKVGKKFGLKVKIQKLPNPRAEKDEHYYNPTHKILLELGYKPSSQMEKELELMFKDVIIYKARIKKEVILPKIKWK
ncbi:MAG TPA: NAD-dependent epimerase/dehydratase family protein [Candidatus Desulfofervidus auxilii]|uniref:NAD-dependent epimerase/dehydratase family protein n=1 Tax=Desulfofervidus auxilii TaxID=1621989 RepID=A0A7C0Y7R5_DESA2|nr:NAD-dependent epimerase/dehydratase family protein [Candidatus Desulfofervidus auxilii]